MDTEQVINIIDEDAHRCNAHINPVIGCFLYSLLKMISAQEVIEVGAYWGYSTLWIAKALKENGGGHIFSFDLFESRPHMNSPIAGNSEDSLAVAQKHINEANVEDMVTFVKGDSSANIEKCLGENHEQYDFALVDGDHRIAGILKDWHVVSKLIKVGGFIALHDTNPGVCGWLGPRWLMDKIDSDGNDKYQIVHFPTVDSLGLALVQKISDCVEENSWRPSISDLIRQWLLHRVHGWHKSGH